MENWKKRAKIRYILTAAVFLCTSVLFVVGSLAAYTNQSFRKGVLSSSATDTLFSSNYLQLWKTDEQKSHQVILFENADGQTTPTVTIPLYLYNYLPENIQNYNQSEIVYDITFTLEGNPAKETLDNYAINSNNPIFTNTNKSYMISGQTLPGRTLSSKRYEIVMPKGDIRKVTITVVAMPTNETIAAANGYGLAAVLSPSNTGEQKPFSCTGTFADAATGNYPYEFDAFNYEVSITSGKAKVTLTWNSTKVEMDPFFSSKVEGKEEPNVDHKTLTFTMDESIIGSYLIPFYRKTAPNKDEDWQKSWQNMESVVTVKGEQITSEN